MGRGPTRTKRDRARLLAELRRRCTEAAFPLTEPRAVILETVVDLGTHPTADEVHEEAAERLPGVGRATVYRTLEALVRIGAFTKASHAGVGVRYDAVVAPHHHLMCLRCDRIFDLQDEDLDRVRVPDTSTLGFEVSDVQVQLRGVCRECQDEEERS